MDIKDSYLHGTIGVVKSISVNEDKLTYTLADINQTTTTVTLPTATQTANGLLSSTDKIKLDTSTGINQSIPYIVGPTTDTTAGTWTGTYAGITDYTEGLTIIYVPNVAGASTTTLNINGIGSKVCYYTGASKVTTHYPAGTPILFTYSGGGWKRADYYYDSLQLRVYRQTTDYNADYPILVSRTLASSIGTSGSNNSYSNVFSLIGDDSTKTPTINPLTGEIKAPKFTGTFNGTASSVTNSLIFKINSGSTEGTNLYTYNGAANKTLDIKQGDNVTLTATEGTLTIAASDSKVTQSDYTGASNLRILLSYYANDTTNTASVLKSSKLTFNPSSGLLTTPKFKGDWTYTSDSRSVATIPSDYKASFKFVGIKDPSVIGLTSTETGSWVSLFGWKGYTDNTGPHTWELASDSNERIWVRSGVGMGSNGSGNEDWKDWHKLAYTSDIPTKISDLTNDSGYLTSHGYIGTTLVQSSSQAQSLTGINNITPSTTNAYNLGNSSTYWNNIYANTIFIGGSANNTTANISSDLPTNMVFYVNGHEALVINYSDKSVRPGLSYNNQYTLGSTSSYFKNLYVTNIDKVNTPNNIILSNNTAITPHLIFQRNTSSDSYNNYHIWGDANGIKFGLSTTDSTNITWLATLGGTNTGLTANKFVIPNGTSSQVLKADGSVEDLSRIEIKTFTAKTDGWYKIGTLPTTRCSFGLFTITKSYSYSPSESYLIAIGAGRADTSLDAYNSEFSINLLLGQYPIQQYIQKIRLSKITDYTTSVEVYITFNNKHSESFQIININSNIIFQTPELVTETPAIYKEMSLVKGIKTSDKFYGDLVGNSDTATTASKLTTSRTIWGQSFDGSADITGNMTEVGTINRVFKVISTQDIAQLNVSEESSTVNYLHLYVSSNNTTNINTRPLILQKGYGNVGIGMVAPTEKLEVNGNVKATSFIGNLDWSYIQNKPTSLPANGGDADTVDGKHANDFLQIYNDNIDDYTQCISLPRIKISYIAGQGDFGSLTIPTFASNLSNYFYQTELRFNHQSGLKYRNLSHSVIGEFQSLLDSRNYTNYVNETNFPGINKVGTITSVGLSVPTGFSVSSSPITTSGTLGITFASGYSLPTTVKQNNWDTVYNWYTGITATDTDALVNKWGEIVDFLDSVAEGTDITDEFVTRKTTQEITGAKTFTKSIKLGVVGSSWLTGMSRASLMYDNYTAIDSLRYHPIIGVKTNAENVVTLGAYINKVGFYGYKAGRVENNHDWSFTFDSATGAITHSGTIISTKFITSGGTAAQFVKGDGSLDSTTYATSASLGNYLPLSGGTLTGWLKFNNEQGISQINPRYNENGGGWANGSIYSKGPNNELIYNLGCYGQNTDIHYIYLGAFDYNSTNNLRIYSDKVVAPKFVTNDGSATQFVKGDGSLDSATYVTSTSLNNYAPKLDGTGAIGTWNIDINKGAKSLNYDTQLTTSEELDNFLSANKLRVTTVTNLPMFTGRDGILLSMSWTNTTFGAQICIDDNNSDHGMVIRHRQANVWKDWKYFAYTSDLTNYVTLNTEQTITGLKTFENTLNIKKGSFELLSLERTDSANSALISFKNTNGLLGWLGMRVLNQGIIRFTADLSTSYTVLDSGNYTSYTPILNSSSEHATNTSVIYAPTTAGTSGQYLMSNGSGAPVWTSLPSLASPYAIKFKNSAGTEVSYNGSQAVDLTGGVYDSIYAKYIKITNVINGANVSEAKANLLEASKALGEHGGLLTSRGQLVDNWNTDNFVWTHGGIGSFFKIGGGYTDSSYSTWLASTITSSSRIGVVRQNNSEWGTMKYLAWTSDIPDTLKNPYAITFTNTTGTAITYDGSTSVDLSSGINYATKSSIANNGIFYIEGTGTTAGTWLGEHDEIKELYQGLTIAYKIPIAGASPTTLKINNLQAVTCYFNTSRYLSTQYPVGSVILLVYDGTYFNISGYDNNQIADCFDTTASSTAAKSASATYYKLRTGNLFICTVYRDNTAAAALTLNVNSTGAKPIWINGTASSATNYTLPAGRYLVYYDGTNYYFYTNGGVKIPQVYGNAETSTNIKIQTLVADSDLNTLTTDGVYGTTATSVCRSLINAPTDRINGEARLEISTCGNSNHVFQTLYTKLSNQYDIWIRSGSTSSFSAWSKILTSSNYDSYAPKLDGTGATGTWGISITGSAATLTTSRTIWGQSFNGSSNIDGDLTIMAGDTDKSIQFLSGSGSTHNWRIAYIGTGTGDTNYLSFESTKATTNTWEPALQLACLTLNATFAGTVTAPNFVQNSNGISDFTNGIIQIKTLNALTNETATTYAKGSAGQILRSNGTNVYWSDLSKLTSTAIKTNQSYSLKNSSWTDTGYSISGLETGSYMIQVTSTNMVASGIFSVQKSLTDTMGDEIPLHVYGSAGWRPYLRTNGTKLEISANHASAVSRTVTIKIVQII